MCRLGSWRCHHELQFLAVGLSGEYPYNTTYACVFCQMATQREYDRRTFGRMWNNPVCHRSLYIRLCYRRSETASIVGNRNWHQSDSLYLCGAKVYIADSAVLTLSLTQQDERIRVTSAVDRCADGLQLRHIRILAREVRFHAPTHRLFVSTHDYNHILRSIDCA